MQKYLPLIQKYLGSIKRYAPIAIFVLVGATYGYLVLTASQQASIQPTEAEISERFTRSSRPRLDETAAAKLEQLEEQNVEVKAIFDEARQNPFAE